MNKNILLVVIFNIVCIICWIAIGIIFDKFWIVLLVLLFISRLKPKYEYYKSDNYTENEFEVIYDGEYSKLTDEDLNKKI